MSSASVAEAGDVSTPQREREAPRPNRRTRNWIIGGAVVFLLLIACFTSGYFISSLSHEGNDASNRKGDKVKPERMSCEWLRECKRERKGTPPLLVISMDGFAKSYPNEKDTPTILKMSECGGRADVTPSYPTKTFPNHYSIATGLRPAKHGIIENKFKRIDGVEFDRMDSSFYSGEPIWNTAVKHGKKSNVVMWFGSYTAINGIEASFHYKGFERLTMTDKINNVTDWLISENPPDLTMLYLEEPDKDGHTYGLNNFEVRESLFTVDAMIKYTLIKLHKAGVLGCTNIVLVSDHGMRDITEYVNLESIDPSFKGKDLKAETHVNFYENVPITELKAKKGEQYRIYRSKDEIPLRYHYDHEYIRFPYLCGNPGVMFFPNLQNLTWFQKELKDKGNHGWDNFDEKMQTIFFAVGPSIKQNVTLAPFQNIELYNLFADLMRIPASPNDGMTGLMDDLLVNAPTRVSSLIETTPCSGSSMTSGYHLASSDQNICYKTEGNLFVLYSQNDKLSIAVEITSLSADLGQLAIDYANKNFGASKLVEKAVQKLAENKGIRIQIGRFTKQSKLFFVAGVWCEGEEKAIEKQCRSEKDTKTEAYFIPEGAEENFNDLPLDDLLFDYRVSIDDIEKATKLNLLPQLMEPAVRRRVSRLIPNSKWKY